MSLDLTTNGAMSKTIAQAVIKTFKYVTISYHAEAHARLKKQSLDRAVQFAEAGVSVKVNVMFHSNYFDECVEEAKRNKLGTNPTSAKL